LRALNPMLDSQFSQAGSSDRTAGGMFLLDGVHPTTIRAGVVAHGMLKVLHDLARVNCYANEHAKGSRALSV
jgi:hypothetical protein